MPKIKQGGVFHIQFAISDAYRSIIKDDKEPIVKYDDMSIKKLYVGCDVVLKEVVAHGDKGKTAKHWNVEAKKI